MRPPGFEQAQCVVGVDVGFRHTGIVLAYRNKSGSSKPAFIKPYVVSTKALTSKQKKTTRVADHDFDQCTELFSRVQHVVNSEAGTIHGWVCELPSAGAKGARANRCMGMATGVFASIVAQSRVPIEMYTPSECKKATTGTNSGTKHMVAHSVLMRFDWDRGQLIGIPETKHEHVYDAASALVAAEDGPFILKNLHWPRTAIADKSTVLPALIPGEKQ